MFLQKIEAQNGAKVLGPYSPAIKLGDFVYLSGQVPVLSNGDVIEGGIVEQAHQVMQNIGAILAEMNLEYRHIVKVTVYLNDLNNFDAFNEVYGSYVSEPFPARTTVEVSRLPKDVQVEVECMVIDTLMYEQQMMQQQGGCSGSCGCDGDCSDEEESCGSGCGCSH